MYITFGYSSIDDNTYKYIIYMYMCMHVCMYAYDIKYICLRYAIYLCNIYMHTYT